MSGCHTVQTLQAGNPPIVKIFGRAGSASAYAIRDFLHRSNVPFEWVDVKGDAHARVIGVAGLNYQNLPVCVFPDGTLLERPTIRQITEKLGWFRDPSLSGYDLAIYGAGTAGLSAAVYGASEGLKAVVVEKWTVGGQAATSSKTENYLGFPSGICGAELAARDREQACRFGAEILIAREGVHCEFSAGKRVGYLANGAKIVASSAICATGIDYRKLGLPAENNLYGAGLYYGAGASEASLCGNEHVFVVGGGNPAGQAATHFSRYARKVSVVIRGDGLKHTLSQYLIDRILSSPQIEVTTQTEVTGLRGDQVLRAITLTNNQTGRQQTFEKRWLFLCLGGVPHAGWAAEVGVARDEEGYLLTGPDLQRGGRYPESWPLERDPYYLETSTPGVFAAGDVRHGSIKRCASAVGEGAMAVSLVHRYLAHS